MITSDAHYELKSELARWSLAAKRSQSDRRLAWANSTCLLFLLIGVVGARTHPPPPKVPALLEEAAPIIVEPLPPPPTDTAKAPAPDESEKNAAPVVVVVPNSPTVSFSVPTVGTLVAPAALAQAPPAETLRAQELPSQPTHLDYTDASGGRPAPEEYPPLALKLHQQGTVVLLMTADANGNILSVDVKQSSGFSVLDRAAKDFVTLHWKLPKGQAGHAFEASVRYILM